MSSSRERFEVVIIGGGIAGNALATVLTRAASPYQRTHERVVVGAR